MTHEYVVKFSEMQRRRLMELAARDDTTVERWVELAALVVAGQAMMRRSPRQEEGTKPRPWGKTPPLVRCAHCHVPTRPVKTCDNCERPLP